MTAHRLQSDKAAKQQRCACVMMVEGDGEREKSRCLVSGACTCTSVQVVFPCISRQDATRTKVRPIMLGRYGPRTLEIDTVCSCMLCEVSDTFPQHDDRWCTRGRRFFEFKPMWADVSFLLAGDEEVTSADFCDKSPIEDRADPSFVPEPLLISGSSDKQGQCDSRHCLSCAAEGGDILTTHRFNNSSFTQQRYLPAHTSAHITRPSPPPVARQLDAHLNSFAPGP